MSEDREWHDDAGGSVPMQAHSLASVEPGMIVRVRCVLFDGVRAVCDAAGIRPGLRVRCLGRRGGQLLLETESGATTRLDQQLARFVEAEPVIGGTRAA